MERESNLIAESTRDRIRQHEAQVEAEVRERARMDEADARTFSWLAQRAGLRRFATVDDVIAFAFKEGEKHVGMLAPRHCNRLERAARRLFTLLEHMGETTPPSGRAA